MNNEERLELKKALLEIPDGPYGDRDRGKLYEPFMKDYGENFKVATQAFIFDPSKLIVGDNVYIGFNSYIGQGYTILQNEVLVGNFVSLTASNHMLKDNSFRFGGFKENDISIGEGSWLGSHVSILAGVTLPKTTLVAAGAVVTKSFETPGLVLGGCPASPISSVETFKLKYNLN